MATREVRLMKIVQLNVQFGYLLPPLLELLSEEAPAIFCAQEVVTSEHPIPLSDNYQTLDHIKKHGDFSHHFFSPTWGTEAFGTRIEIGNAIFSKLPIAHKETVFISKTYQPFQTAQNWDFNVRSLQICQLKIDSKNL